MKHVRSYMLRDEGNTRVSAYESYLDLFTLLSFILIIASFIYVSKSEQYDQNVSPTSTESVSDKKTSTSILAQVAERGIGVPQRLPKDSILLVIYREDAIDKLAVVDGDIGGTNQYVVKVETANTILDKLLPTLNSARVIDIAVYKGKEDVNPSIFLVVSRW